MPHFLDSVVDNSVAAFCGLCLAEQCRTKREAELVDRYYKAHNPGEVMLWKLLLNEETGE